MIRHVHPKEESRAGCAQQPVPANHPAGRQRTAETNVRLESDKFPSSASVDIGRSEAAELIRAHYELQKGAFISQWQERENWICVLSEVSAVPMWNHAAWLGYGPENVGDFLAQAQSTWRDVNRRPVVYVIDEPGLEPIRQGAALQAGLEKCDQESWMVYGQSERPAVASVEDIKVRAVVSSKDRAEFLSVFRAAYQARGESFARVFSEPEAHDGREVQHYVGWFENQAVCIASLISAGDLACVYNVGTLPRARSRGFAAQMLAVVIGDSLTHGHRRLFLQVEKGSGAERLYSRLGFSTAFTRSGYRLIQWPQAPFLDHGRREVRREMPQFLATIHCESFPIAPREYTKVVISGPSNAVEVARAVAAQAGVRAESVWMAAWALLLSRYSHESRVGFGIQSGGATVTGWHFCPFWVDVPEETPLLEWLQQIAEGLRLKMAAAPDALDTEQDLFFESALRLDSVEAGAGFEQTRRSDFEWRLDALRTCQFEVHHRSGKYSQESICRLAEHFFAVVTGMAKDVTQQVAHLDLLSPAEREQLLVHWNRPWPPPPEFHPVHRLFEAEVARAPGVVAVTLVARSGLDSESQHVTYDQLNRRANQLAADLQRAGIAPEQRVALYLERSVEMVAGLLAVLKTGAVCLPLDPAYPQQRLEFMLADARVAAVLTQHSLVESLSASTAKMILVDSDPEAFISATEPSPFPTSAPGQGAYVIYTSGSTGQPKGVLITHRAIAGHCLECKASYGLTARDRVLQFNSLSFDAAFEQVLATLVSGATLVLRGQEVWTPQEFGQRMQELSLSVVDLPTAYWHQLLQEWSHNASSAPRRWPRLMIVGGEAMSPESLRLWQQLPTGEVRLLNAYGPTEATITATSFEITPKLLNQELPARIPIGRPRGARSAYVLDPRGRPVPIGVGGELFLGGPWLAREYLNRPELTRERFVASPLHPDSSERLYKTGDRARFLPDGNLEFLGRTDQQTKIRGYRVELGEIEAALCEHHDLRECAVIVQEQGSHPQLAAFVVPRNGQCPSGRQLREFLQRRLPEYMVPSRFAALDALPWLPSGKIDRRALAAASVIESTADSSQGPRDSMELRLQLLFERILQQSGIGVDVSFFELGGDSLQALELIVQLERISGKSLPLETLYQSPTVEALAKRIEDQGSSAEWSSLVPLQSGGSRPPLFLVHTTPGDVLGYGNLIYHLDPGQPCYGFQSLGLLRPELSHHRIEEMAACYLGLLRSWQPQGPYYLAGWCYGGIVAVEMAQQLHARGEKVGFLGLLETVALAPSLKFYRYYLHRIGCFLRMQPRQWLRYVQKKLEYRREVKQADKMRFRRLDRVEGANPAVLEEHNRKLEKLEQVYSSNMKALRLYRPVAYPGRVTLFNAEKVDDGVIQDPLYAWAGLAAEIEVHQVPGDHDTMLTEPNVRTLARKLDECLQRAQAAMARQEAPRREPSAAPVPPRAAGV